MHPKNISIAGYRYDLPETSIAFYPLAERDASRLLIYRDGGISEDIYRNIGDHLPEGSLLVFNNTRVVEARILFQKETGGQIEIFCLEPPNTYGGMAAAMSQKGSVHWKCLIGGASKWKHGQVLRKRIGDGSIVLEARYLGKEEDAFLIGLCWSPEDLSFAELLHEAGLIPLPPYIRRTAESSDSERYQTVYARHDGSVAAPTAGLHFTEAIFTSLTARHIRRTFVTLHVGAGTFLPVKAATMEGHSMHTEFIAVQRETIRELLDAPFVIPVGTTSARTIESLYWLGLKTVRDPRISPADLAVHQWDAYGGIAAISPGVASADASPISPRVALQSLLAWMDRKDMPHLLARTQLLITPGYDWKIVKALVTNFHQPESTLLLLVASLIGEDWRKVYDHALKAGYRFLSYGDGSLLHAPANSR